MRFRSIVLSCLAAGGVCILLVVAAQSHWPYWGVMTRAVALLILAVCLTASGRIERLRFERAIGAFADRQLLKSQTPSVAKMQALANETRQRNTTPT